MDTGHSPSVLIGIDELQKWRAACDVSCQKLAFVPTMGALHAGHLSLVEKAKTLGERVIVSIFVNPKQFGPSEDFSAYPRVLEADMKLLTEVKGVDAVFVPNSAEIYDSSHMTMVTNPELSHILCGKTRANHFDGVLTVVLKLLNLVRPHVAIFGRKDFQQLKLIEIMARDLNLLTRIESCVIVREKDGLAMSSRNRYLQPDERELAVQISRALNCVESEYTGGERKVEQLVRAFVQQIAKFNAITLEYAELRLQKDLRPADDGFTEPAVFLFAGRIGLTRLIDNIELPGT